MSRPGRVRRHGERGSALVEFAFVLPLLGLLALGVIEFGMAWQDRLTVQTGVRAGVRVGSAQGKAATADQQVLLSVGAALHDMGLSNVDWVMVYKSATSDGAPPPACLTPVPHSVSGSCNAYTGAQLTLVVGGSAPAAWFGCGGGSLDVSWCPTSRQSVQALGNDYLGVRVTARHPPRRRRHAARAPGGLTCRSVIGEGGCGRAGRVVGTRVATCW